MYEWLLKKLGWTYDHYTSPFTRPDELFHGATKPTTTLAHMLAAEILKVDIKSGPILLKGEVLLSVTGNRFETYTFPNGARYLMKLVESACDSYSQVVGKGKGFWVPREISVHSGLRIYTQKYCRNNVKGYAPEAPDITLTGIPTFDEREMAIIKEAVLKAILLTEKRAEIAADAENQNKAVDIIAKFMGV